MLTKEEAAAKLDGNEYGEEGSPDLWKAMKEAGLVAVFGASDDLMEFRGAIDDEIDAWEGTTAYLDRDGLLKNDCNDGDCPYFEKMQAKATTIKALWGADGFSWRYQTAIPHAKFVIKEDGENYSEGIVFALADVAL